MSCDILSAYSVGRGRGEEWGHRTRPDVIGLTRALSMEMRRLALLLRFTARGRSYLPPPIVQVRAQRRINTGGLTNLYDEAQTPALQVRNVSHRGIELEDGLIYTSACILLGGQSFSWRVPGQPWEGWSSDAFEIFNVVSPKPGPWHSTILLLRNTSTHQSSIELLLLGTGKSLLLPPPSIREYLRKAGISMDVMDTVSALVIQLYTRLMSGVEKCMFNVQFIV